MFLFKAIRPNTINRLFSTYRPNYIPRFFERLRNASEFNKAIKEYPRHAIYLFNKMKDLGLKPDESTVISVIEALGSRGRINNLKFFLNNVKFPPTTNTMNAIISVMVKHGHKHYARYYWQEMIQLNVPRTIETYNMLLETSESDNDLELFLQQMHKDGLRPNTQSFHLMISFFLEHQKIENCMNLFNVLVKEHETLPLTFELLEDFVKKLLEINRTEEALDVFVKGKKMGITRLNEFYHHFIEYIIYSENMEFLKQILEEAKKDGKDIHTLLRSEVKIFLSQEIGKIIKISGSKDTAFRYLKFIEKALDETGTKMDEQIFSRLIEQHCKIGSLGDAIDIFKKYKDGIKNRSKSYYSIIIALVGRGEQEKAVEMLRVIIDHKLGLDKIGLGNVINSIFAGYMRRNSTDEIWELFEKLKPLRPFDAASFAILLDIKRNDKDEEAILDAIETQEVIVHQSRKKMGVILHRVLELCLKYERIYTAVRAMQYAVEAKNENETLNLITQLMKIALKKEEYSKILDMMKTLPKLSLRPNKEMCEMTQQACQTKEEAQIWHQYLKEHGYHDNILEEFISKFDLN